MLRAALYVRVSTEEQKTRGLSIEAQETALKEWAKEHEYIAEGVYNDAGISARKRYTKRPALQRLLSDVECGKIDIILFTKLDRWFRNIADYYEVQKILDKHSVTWKTIHEDYDTITASGRLKVNIMLSVAQDEADRDSERIKAVFDSKRAKGEVVTGSVPTGYIIEDKKLKQDPQWKPVIDTFFEVFAAVKSTYEARMETERRTGVPISYQLADLFLKKKCYCGYFAGIDCPPYISTEQFNLNQNLRKKTERRTKSNRVFLFTGIVYCGVCGNRYQAMHNTQKRSSGIYEIYIYNCSGHYKRSNCSNKVNMREVFIEQYLLDNIDKNLDEYLSVVNCEPTARAQTDTSKTRRKLERLKELYLNELINLDEYKRDAAELQSFIEPPPVPAQVNVAQLRSILNDGWKCVYAALSREGKRAFWKSIIDKVMVNEDRSLTIIFLTT